MTGSACRARLPTHTSTDNGRHIRRTPDQFEGWLECLRSLVQCPEKRTDGVRVLLRFSRSDPLDLTDLDPIAGGVFEEERMRAGHQAALPFVFDFAIDQFELQR